MGLPLSDITHLGRYPLTGLHRAVVLVHPAFLKDGQHAGAQAGMRWSPP